MVDFMGRGDSIDFMERDTVQTDPGSAFAPDAFYPEWTIPDTVDLNVPATVETPTWSI